MHLGLHAVAVPVVWFLLVCDCVHGSGASEYDGHDLGHDGPVSPSRSAVVVA